MWRNICSYSDGRLSKQVVCWVVLVWISFLARGPVVSARVTCFNNYDCETKLRKGSECLGGICSNPYHKGGCLPARLKDFYKIRTCSSDDPPSSIAKGYCVPSTLGYTEVRISSQNWESVFFGCWILQILLSELLDVPVTIETGTATDKVDFYDINTSFDYGVGNDWESVRTSARVKDCRKVKNMTNYTACSHVVPEVWSGYQETLEKMTNNQQIEAPSGLGALGTQFWFVRKATARRHPELMVYLSMQGPEGRQRLASVFKRPTTWEDYCSLVSKNGCQTPDDYAQRPPKASELNIYYDSINYKGYFRFTEKNNCTLTPLCTGHIVDYPCGWASFVLPQTYYNDIALESNGKEKGSNGFTYSQMVQIWTAADALDEDVVMLWWRPESLYYQFLGTESEFTPVILPPPTEQCVKNRISAANRCGSDVKLRLGDPKGACSDDPNALWKVISSALYEISYDSKKPAALYSPAYDAIKKYRISDLQLGELFDNWFNISKDKWNLDPRDAVCDYVVQNLDMVKSFIPRGHPRTIEEDTSKSGVFYAAVVLGSIAVCASVVSTFITYRQRDKTIMRYAQIEFLFLLLIGLILVSIAAVLTAFPPTDGLCVSVAWFVNFGYTLDLVPLVVKVAAIHRLMVASAQMRRVELRMSSLFGAVALVFLLVLITLIVWTVVDPPERKSHYELTDNLSDNGETIITKSYYCDSDSDFWKYMGVGWQLLLLLCASILAFQTRSLRGDLNETKTLAIMIYSHFVFVLLRAITYVLDNALNNPSILEGFRSILYSLDTLATLVIYFVPKFLRKESDRGAARSSKQSDEQPRPLPPHKWELPPRASDRPDRLTNASSDLKWEDPNESRLQQISEEVSEASDEEHRG